MKKTIFLVAITALAVISCSKNYEAIHPKTDGTAISIGSWANNLTRARTAGTSTFASGDKFYVYGYTSGAQTPFDGDAVSFDGTDWTYSPLRFWDRNNDYYSFYAVSPSEDVAVADLIDSHNVQTGVMTSKALTFAGSDNDILVADSVKVLKAHYGETVQLNFRHIASLFDLKVRKGDGIGANGTLAITAVSLTSIDSLGTFSVTGYDTANNNKATVTWAATAQGTYTNASGVVPVSTLPTDVTTTGDQFLIDSLVVMPQTFAASKQQLKISYTITTGTGASQQVNTFTDKTYDLVLFDNTDYPTDDSSTAGNQYNAGTNVTGWVGGVHYTYVITIDAEAITFNATMTDWTTDNGYYYILN